MGNAWDDGKSLRLYYRMETSFPYDNKRSARIALQRNGRMSLARPAAGGESCFAGSFFIQFITIECSQSVHSIVYTENKPSESTF